MLLQEKSTCQPDVPTIKGYAEDRRFKRHSCVPLEGQTRPDPTLDNLIATLSIDRDPLPQVSCLSLKGWRIRSSEESGPGSSSVCSLAFAPGQDWDPGELVLVSQKADIAYYVADKVRRPKADRRRR